MPFLSTNPVSGQGVRHPIPFRTEKEAIEFIKYQERLMLAKGSNGAPAPPAPPALGGGS